MCIFIGLSIHRFNIQGEKFFSSLQNYIFTSTYKNTKKEKTPIFGTFFSINNQKVNLSSLQNYIFTSTSFKLQRRKTPIFGTFFSINSQKSKDIILITPIN